MMYFYFVTVQHWLFSFLSPCQTKYVPFLLPLHILLFSVGPPVIELCKWSQWKHHNVPKNEVSLLVYKREDKCCLSRNKEFKGHFSTNCRTRLKPYKKPLEPLVIAFFYFNGNVITKNNTFNSMTMENLQKFTKTPLSQVKKSPCKPGEIGLLCAMRMCTLITYTWVSWLCSRSGFFSPRLGMVWLLM